MKCIHAILCAVGRLDGSVSAGEPLTQVDLGKPPAGVERLKLFLLIGQPTYQARLVRMRDDLRADLAAPELPFIAATIGERMAAKYFELQATPAAAEQKGKP